MTTAARPTFEPARGGRGKGEGDLSALSKQYSSRDLPSHTKLKYRQTGQSTSDEIKSRDLRRELEEKEEVSRHKRHRDGKPRSFTEAPSIASGGSSSSSKRPRSEHPPPPVNLDADDDLGDDDDDDDDSDEDDTAELLRELQKIRKERKEEEEKKDNERREEEERIRTENLLKGNPLLHQNQSSGGTDFKIKRRWDDDVVFKNCAKAQPKEQEKHFINDTIRSEFHRKFMDKYIK
ncbi:spliceosome-associated protein CWC15 homolog [Halichondria panicea]|uniref:spliceosome-associated protein CWC15 homolog n=1 Tax=Halichondria panicea TaxID=6063 RepID=UPI00312B7D21